MKKIVVLSLISFLIFSCNCKKKATEENKNMKAQLLNSCPENFECTLEVFPNKTMNVKTGDVSGTYFELEDFNGTTVYHYTYNQKTNKLYQDAGYREEIIFELASDVSDLKLSDEELQKAKMIFGVWCYCKGKAGNYKVAKGNFSKKGNEISIDFPAVVDDQKVKELRIKL
ncbi:hypothetical protein J2X31_000768 [Flavobacterium arsenatis]|uniref:Lipoprotein n=1 Tax=Flavobacterium arsenatis TaxID=1484332 RepID=A0ABU1TLF9_9FLAO|nr:hypothetical protein [Flavobacterium arsenatis]MDR6966770.1 hypothetical protein [Flavobacterium arsenatis]